ncbi:hypothetical protein GCM10020255_011180 [Rhodococcus baikonurensis]
MQCVGLSGAQLLPSSQATGQLGAAVGFDGQCCAEFVLAAGRGVVEIAGVVIGGYGGGNASLQARMSGVLVERNSGNIDSGCGFVETLADVRGAARGPGLGLHIGGSIVDCVDQGREIAAELRDACGVRCARIGQVSVAAQFDHHRRHPLVDAEYRSGT